MPEGPAAEYDLSEAMRRLGQRRFAANAGDSPEVAEMRLNRSVNRRTAGQVGTNAGGASSMQFATGRPRDPLFYWKQNNLPYDVTQHQELKRVREYCRLLQMSHPVIGSCIDIFSKYPLLGSELSCKDDQLKEFYDDLFFSDERLNYNEFFIDIGREYWTVGEAWPFGSFNEALGIWEDDELLNPDDVEVQRSPFLREPRFLIKLPASLREVISKRSPAWEYAKLMEAYPELANYASADDLMPVSNILLRQMKFKADTFNKRGVPLLMRAMRSVMQEEMLNAAMDSVADRLYTPLILAKLGASATDLGTSVPWIPTPGDLEDFNEAFDMAMAGDFRVLTHHFAITVETVFGRENMPDMSNDFDRLESRILQTFGMSQTMLSGASSGETYAADALNRDLISQLLTTFQSMIKRHYRQRAMVVAEAQEHYDYDLRNGKRYVKMEEILEIDEESGEERIVEQPKLLIPDLTMKTMNLKDETEFRQFVEGLREGGVPISMKRRLANSDIDLEEETERLMEEQVNLAVAEQETRKKTYLALRAKGLPIPQPLLDDFEAKADQANPSVAASEGRSPLMGTDPDVDLPNLAPTPEDIAGDPVDGTEVPGVPGTAVDPSQGNVIPFPGQENPDVPPESNEQRQGMPTAAALHRQATRMREITAEFYVAPSTHVNVPLTDDERASLQTTAAATGEAVDIPAMRKVSLENPTGNFSAPKHIGMRRHAKVDKAKPMEEWGSEESA